MKQNELDALLQAVKQSVQFVLLRVRFASPAGVRIGINYCGRA
jgi:hypothetical protein